MNLHGTYTDITEIGSGGGGTVFKAYHVRMQKYIVLKKIHDSIASSVDIRGELDILKNLRHEYLPTVLDFFEDEGSVYTVMDYIPGDSFQNLIKKDVHFTQAQVIKYALQLGQVLKYLHEQKVPIIHGDIKPANIMLTPEDNICLIDFNISQLQNGAADQTMGYTPGFSSPEQVRIVQKKQAELMKRPKTGAALSAGEGSETTALLADALNGGDETVLLEENTKLKMQEKNRMQKAASETAAEKLDARSDIFSAGASLYAIFSGKAPDFDCAKTLPIEQAVSNCSEGLAYLINRCMNPDPGKRFQTADDLIRAVQGIPKVDRRYRHLLLRQNLAVMGCILGMTAGVLLTFAGRDKMAEEKVQAYNHLVQEMERIVSEENAPKEELWELHDRAVDMFPDRADAYYQKAIFLYNGKMYEELVDYLSRQVLSHTGTFSDEDTADFYFLLASGYTELNDLESAESYYRTAAGYNAGKSVYYTDFAIVLARLDKLDEAEKILEKAVELGLSNDHVELIRGEIAAKRGKRAEAEEHFAECVKITKDPYVLFRAYVFWGELYDDSREEGMLNKKIDVLTKGLNAIEEKDRAVLLESLTQAYIDLGKLTEDEQYYRQALERMQEITKMGWDTFVTHSNIGILYEQLGELELADREFENMLSLYGEDYRIYKRRALLEIEIQQKKENEDRDYGQFVIYYNKTKQLFQESGLRADSDMEVQMLDQVYNQLREGNWFEE